MAICSCTGCQDFQYLASLFSGELSVQLEARPIEDVLASGRLDGETDRKLRMVQTLRRYAIDSMGLRAGASYTHYYDSRGLPTAYNLSAAPRTSLEPNFWTIPFVGTVPNLLFFEREPLLKEIEILHGRGLDTFAYEVDAYSTRGFLADPVPARLLENGDAHIANVILHELTHNTIWRVADTPYNESLAVFVGQTGTLAFLRETRGADAPILQEARRAFADEALYNAFLADLYNRLAELFASDIPEDEKLAARSGIYQDARRRFRSEVYPAFHDPPRFDGILELPENNAWLVVNRRYTLDLDLFRQVHEAAGNDFLESLPVFAQAARAPAAKAYLRAWLENH